MDRLTYGPWLRTERRRRGITQKDIEIATGISESHLSKIERGKISLPDEDTRIRIHQLLGTTDEDLAQVGILERLESPGGGGPVYINPENVRGITQTAHISVIGHPLTASVSGQGTMSSASLDVQSRLSTLIEQTRLTTAQVDALVTILESFARPVDQP